PAATAQAVDADVRAARRERRRARRRSREQLGQLADRDLVPPALDWIDRAPEQPFLLVVWTVQAHAPYVNGEPPALLDARDPNLNRYLNALREDDRMIADLLQGLAARGVLDATLLVVTGDHGESFGAHGVRFHGRSLDDDEVLVPLVLSHPSLRSTAPARRSTIAQQIDVAPTILDLLGLPIPAPWQGDSLFAVQRSNEAFLVSVFETTRFGLVRDERKYVFDERLEPLALRDRSGDPDERRDLALRPDEHAAIADARARLAGWLRAQDAYLERLLGSGASGD
ncbi:sulfatase-like hydrolase/transferase, partial [Candidatus Binatia bacterium]|nr:sulfatase-like hydrolase/transferase [Candidatus Binatia bacterium]